VIHPRPAPAPVAQPRLLLILTENWTMRPPPDLGDLVDFAVAAEQAGIDGVMVSEHIVLGPSAHAGGLPENPRDYALPGNQDPATPWPSPLVLLSAIAAATERIRLVAGALISPLRHPLATAKDLATLDRLSRGRLVVLPTVSWHADEFAALGVPFGQRGDILDEQLEIWARAWTGSPVCYSGRHYQFGDVWLEPQPLRPGGPALWFGGSSVHRRLIRRLVRYGSGFNPLGQPDDAGLAALAAALTAAGRSPAELEYVGGTRGVFRGTDDVADLDAALAGIPAQVACGFTTICVKPGQFLDETARIGEFCRELVAKVAALPGLPVPATGPAAAPPSEPAAAPPPGRARRRTSPECNP
jgi:probable F420-dependent oxidoreductase